MTAKMSTNDWTKNSNQLYTYIQHTELRWSYGYADVLQVFVRGPVYIRECVIIKIRDQVSP